ncbi:hypothetical protein [Desulfosporosinus fructosivorans]
MTLRPGLGTSGRSGEESLILGDGTFHVHRLALGECKVREAQGRWGNGAFFYVYRLTVTWGWQ